MVKMNGKANEKLGLGKPDRNSVTAVRLPEPPGMPGPGVCWTWQQPCRHRAEERACGECDRNPSFAGRTVLVISPVPL